MLFKKIICADLYNLCCNILIFAHLIKEEQREWQKRRPYMCAVIPKMGRKVSVVWRMEYVCRRNNT